MASPSSVLAWRILWTEEPGGLQPTGSQGAGRVTNALVVFSRFSPYRDHCAPAHLWVLVQRCLTWFESRDESKLSNLEGGRTRGDCQPEHFQASSCSNQETVNESVMSRLVTNRSGANSDKGRTGKLYLTSMS